MKKKFLISGAAVFLAVCLLTSALFAFADSPVSYVLVNNGIYIEFSDFPDPSTVHTSKGGIMDLYYDSENYFVIPNYLGYFYFYSSSVGVHGISAFPSVGSEVVSNFVTLNGVDTGDEYNGSPIYRFSLPSDYPYYLFHSYIVYSPPLFVVVNNYISGFFTAAGDFFDGVMSVPILAILVIGVPVTGLITAITLGLTVGRKKNKSYKKSRRRR